MGIEMVREWEGGGNCDKTEREGKWGNCDAFIEITYHSLRAATAELVMDGQQKHMR